MRLTGNFHQEQQSIIGHEESIKYQQGIGQATQAGDVAEDEAVGFEVVEEDQTMEDEMAEVVVAVEATQMQGS